MNPEDQCNIALCFDSDTDCQCYNLPTATEIAIILLGDGDQPTNTHNIILQRRGGGSNVRTSEMHPFYHALHYVLLFPTGKLGWHPHLPFIDGVEVNDDAPAQNPIPAEDQDEDEDGQVDVPSKKHKYLSQTEYFHYQLQPCHNETLHVFLSQKLLQEFIVDCWAASEQNCLDWVRFNQHLFWSATWQGLIDAEGANIGQQTILPSSFAGSTQNMIQNCQDALAINHYYQGADLFLTATANPKWPGIQEALLPRQSASDCPDIIGRVFHRKMAQLIKDICEHGIMGCTVA